MPKPRQRESDRFNDSSLPNRGLDRSLSRTQRLTASARFAETFAGGRKYVGRYMILWLRCEPDAALRLGVITSKKVHLRANRRNFARRRLREAYRNLRPFFTGEYDVLLIARRSVLTADWKAVLNELLTLADRAGLLTESNRSKARQTYELDA